MLPFPVIIVVMVVCDCYRLEPLHWSFSNELNYCSGHIPPSYTYTPNFYRVWLWVFLGRASSLWYSDLRCHSSFKCGIVGNTYDLYFLSTVYIYIYIPRYIHSLYSHVSVQILLSSRFLAEILKTNIHKIMKLPLLHSVIWLWNLISYIKGRSQAKGTWKQDPEANI